MGQPSSSFRKYVLFFLAAGTVASAAAASPSSFTYHGKIVNANGLPLEYQSVSFEFTIMNPGGSCVIYRERKDGVDMRNSKGLFDTSLGTGTKYYPTNPTFTLLSAFANTAALNCEGGGTYTPLADDIRMLRVQFFDGNGWRLITPDNAIRSVPFAGYAENATSSTKLGTNVAADFQLKNDIPVCTGAEVLTSTVLGTLTCVAGGGGGGGSGTVTNIATGTGLTGGPITTTGTISLETIAGLTPGTYGSATAVPAITVDAKGRVTAISTSNITGLLPAASGASGKYLKSDGTNWAGADIRFSDIKNSLGASAFNTASCAANQTVKWSSLTDMFECQNISESDPEVGSNTTNYLSKWNGTALVASTVIENSGYVGIGTNNPTSLLTLNASDPTLYSSTGTTPSPFVETSAVLSIHNASQTDGAAAYLELTARDSVDRRKSFYLGAVASAGSNKAPEFVMTSRTSTGFAERMRIDKNGNVGIGTAAPSRNLEVSGSDVNTGIRVVNTTSSTARGPNVSIRNYTNGNSGSPYLELLNSGGTQASPVAIVSNQVLGTVGFIGGYDTSGGYAVGASISVAAEDNYSSTSTPGRILFKTTPSGSTSEVERMRITSTGNVIVTGKITADQAFETLADGGTVTWTVAGLVNNATVTLAGNRILAFSGLTNGMSGTLIVNQDGTGGRTLTLPAQCSNKVVDGGSGAITLSAGANAIDILKFTYDGANCYWTYGKNFN